MRDVYCYISIELSGDLAVDKPLTEIARLLRQAADEVEAYEEGQDLEICFVFRIARQRVGQLDLDVCAEDSNHD